MKKVKNNQLNYCTIPRRSRCEVAYIGSSEMAELNIGLRQARRLAELTSEARLTFISEGLPIILNSATGLLKASKALSEQARESDILRGFAEEEAAKGLILLDIVRCPPKLVSQKLSVQMRSFYDHLARLLYAKACHMRPVTAAQLQEYVDHNRRTHYLEGNYGEYILPNNELFARESMLYADIAAYEDKKLFWNVPHSYKEGLPTLLSFDPPSVRVLEALSALGVFSGDGLRIANDVWGETEFVGGVGAQESDRLIQLMVGRLLEQRLPQEHAKQDDISLLYNSWQFPMYNVELTKIPVTLEELNAERESQMPYDY
jgi:hypothetical protein